jgi:hypothetical protein
MRYALIILCFLLTACQPLRDAVQAARINRNLDDTDRVLQHYADKAERNQK